MKRTLSILMALALALACAMTAGAEGLSGTIRYSTWGSIAEKEVNEKIIAAFMEENPGCTVELEYIPENYPQKIDTMFLGGDAPDVIYGHPHQFASWAANDLLMNLNDLFEEEKDFFYDDKFATEMYPQYCYKGDHIATVNGHDCFLLFYNKDMFDEAGVAYPTDDWTWDDFVEAGKKLTQEVNGSMQYAMTFDDLYAIVASFGGQYFDDMTNPTAVAFNSPETVEALDFVQKCIYEYGIAPDTKNAELLGGSFTTGKVAMQITGAWGVAENAKITTFNWDIARVPKPAGREHKTMFYVAGYAVNADTKNPELAKAFAKYFQSDRAQELLAGPGLITVINKEIASSDAVLKGEGAPEHAYLRVDAVAEAVNGYPMLTNFEEMRTKVLTPAYDRLIAGSYGGADCAADIHSGLEALLPQGL